MNNKKMSEQELLKEFDDFINTMPDEEFIDLVESMDNLSYTYVIPNKISDLDK